MKHALALFTAVVLVFAASSTRAEDAKTEKSAPEQEWSGSTACAKCSFAKESDAKKCSPAIKVGDKVYLLAGDALKKEMPGCCGKAGDYTVKGKLSDDGKTIEVTAITEKAKK